MAENQITEASDASATTISISSPTCQARRSPSNADGNLTSDGQRTCTWDAENRLIGIGYPSTPGKATAFTYDGLGRRVAISSTLMGSGSATTTSYLWCGSDICQARNASNTPIKGYYDEGEFVPGTPGQPYYYGIDQIGSVRRAFASPTSAPAYSYGPYGVPLQATAPVTDFVYGGMFYNADSGLYLTNYRAYDPVAGRWLSRDPLGEMTDPVGNLYPYVGGSPTSQIDPNGNNPVIVAAVVGAVASGGTDLAAQLIKSGGNLKCVDWASVGQSAVIGAVTSVAAEGLVVGVVEKVVANRVAQAIAALRAIGRAPNFVVTPGGGVFPVPAGASGPTSTRAPGIQFVGGSGGGPGLNANVTGVRFMDANGNQGARAIYMNQSGQTVNPFTGRTVPYSDPSAHFYYP